MRTRIWMTAMLFFLVASGCSSGIDGRQAVEIAQQTVGTEDTWADRAAFDAKRRVGQWVVTAWRIEGYGDDGEPKFVPGGFRVVRIDNDGNVLDYRRGR